MDQYSWILGILGLILIVNGAWRVIWRITIILSLMAAIKAGTVKGSKKEQDKVKIEELKKNYSLSIWDAFGRFSFARNI